MEHRCWGHLLRVTGLSDEMIRQSREPSTTNLQHSPSMLKIFETMKERWISRRHPVRDRVESRISSSTERGCTGVLSQRALDGGGGAGIAGRQISSAQSIRCDKVP